MEWETLRCCPSLLPWSPEEGPRLKLDPTQVRKCLQLLLNHAEQVTADHVLPSGLSVGEFCTLYVWLLEERKKEKTARSSAAKRKQRSDDGEEPC